MVTCIGVRVNENVKVMVHDRIIVKSNLPVARFKYGINYQVVGGDGTFDHLSNFVTKIELK